MSQNQIHSWGPQSYMCISNSPTLQNLDTYFTWIQFQRDTWNYLKQHSKSLKIRDLFLGSAKNESEFLKMGWSLLEVKSSASKPFQNLKISLSADCLTDYFGQITCTLKMSRKIQHQTWSFHAILTRQEQRLRPFHLATWCTNSKLITTAFQILTA